MTKSLAATTETLSKEQPQADDAVERLVTRVGPMLLGVVIVADTDRRLRRQPSQPTVLVAPRTTREGTDAFHLMDEIDLLARGLLVVDRWTRSGTLVFPPSASTALGLPAASAALIFHAQLLSALMYRCRAFISVLCRHVTTEPTMRALFGDPPPESLDDCLASPPEVVIDTAQLSPLAELLAVPDSYDPSVTLALLRTRAGLPLTGPDAATSASSISLSQRSQPRPTQAHGAGSLLATYVRGCSKVCERFLQAQHALLREPRRVALREVVRYAAHGDAMAQRLFEPILAAWRAERDSGGIASFVDRCLLAASAAPGTQQDLMLKGSHHFASGDANVWSRLLRTSALPHVP